MLKRALHVAAIPLAITALVLLVVFASARGSVAQVVGMSIFGAALIVFHTGRAVSAFLHHEGRREWLAR